MDFDEGFRGFVTAEKNAEIVRNESENLENSLQKDNKLLGIDDEESPRGEEAQHKVKKKAKGKGKKEEVAICRVEEGEDPDFVTVPRYRCIESNSRMGKKYTEKERDKMKQKVEVNEGEKMTSDNLLEEKSRKRRKVTASCALRSPYTCKFGSNEKDNKNKVTGTKKIYTKARAEMCLDDFSELRGDKIADFALVTFLKFLNEGKSSKRSIRLNKRYTATTDVIPEPFRYTVAIVDSKTFFYNLYTPNEWLSDEHMDILFYHLWKKGKYCDEIKYSFTTTDVLFHTRIHSSVRAVERLDLNSNLTKQLDIKDHVASRMIGRGIWCGKHWGDVDHVLFLMNTGGNHWILGRFEVKKRTLFIYDSMMKRRSYKDTKQTANEYAKVIPYYLHAFSVFVARDEVFLSHAYLIDNPVGHL